MIVRYKMEIKIKKKKPAPPSTYSQKPNTNITVNAERRLISKLDFTLKYLVNFSELEFLF